MLVNPGKDPLYDSVVEGVCLAIRSNSRGFGWEDLRTRAIMCVGYSLKCVIPHDYDKHQSFQRETTINNFHFFSDYARFLHQNYVFRNQAIKQSLCLLIFV